MIEMQRIHAGYGSQPVLQGIDLCCPTGQITAIIGKNGCGKSTLLKVLANILPITQGTVRIEGKEISCYSRGALAQTLSYMPQSRNIPEISVERMVLHGRFPYLSYPRSYRQEDRSIARKCMERLGIWDLRDMQLSALSGGMRQKVYIAMALAQETAIVLMDEPTTFLDISHQYQIMDQAKELAASGKTVVVVLHDLAVALQNADQIAVMDAGKLLFCGKPDAVYESGCLEQAFHVKPLRFMTGSGWQYYFERG